MWGSSWQHTTDMASERASRSPQANECWWRVQSSQSQGHTHTPLLVRRSQTLPARVWLRRTTPLHLKLNMSHAKPQYREGYEDGSDDGAPVILDRLPSQWLQSIATKQRRVCQSATAAPWPVGHVSCVWLVWQRVDLASHTYVRTYVRVRTPIVMGGAWCHMQHESLEIWI